jgi:hypothetical protein
VDHEYARVANLDRVSGKGYESRNTLRLSLDDGLDWFACGLEYVVGVETCCHAAAWGLDMDN